LCILLLLTNNNDIFLKQSDLSLDIRLKVDKRVYVGVWIFEETSLDADLISVPSEMALFKVNCKHHDITFLKADLLEILSLLRIRTSLSEIVDATQGLLFCLLNATLFLKLLIRPVGHNKLEHVFIF
jgi:hypothetical protein